MSRRHDPQVGEIYSSRESLVLPYHEILLKGIEDFSDSASFRSCSLETQRTLQTVRTQCTQRIQELRRLRHSKKGGRPVIICYQPDWYTGEKRPWVFPMGTFGGDDYDSLPNALKKFAVPVRIQETTLEALESGKHIETAPTWKAQRGKPAWVVAIAMSTASRQVPTCPWTHRATGGIFALMDGEYRELSRIRNKLLQEFNRDMQDPEFMKQFWEDLQRKQPQRPGGLTNSVRQENTQRQVSSSLRVLQTPSGIPLTLHAPEVYEKATTDTSIEETDNIGQLVSAVESMVIQPKGVLNSLRSVTSRRRQADRRRRNSGHEIGIHDKAKELLQRWPYI
ncbi:hypothetical protein BDZ89DRAFT_1155552 [Hymenopellis radicata]|nr:hypothetical protein BDZ89DRAFT_1155552 [Hymenopellis radicata]